MAAYSVKNIATGRIFEDRFTDKGFLLSDPKSADDSLLQTVYPKDARIDTSKNTFERYAGFIPTNRPIPPGSRSITYHATTLGEHLGLEQLYITVSGYVPRLGTTYMSGSFKECEALSVFARMPQNAHGKTLVIASAGNTARAFAHIAELCEQPVLLVVAEQNASALWCRHPDPRFVRVLHVAHGDYYDAIHAANIVCSFDGFIPEGGAKNIARRDGMGTTMHEAISVMEAIPQHYFQAVGSGTGAIAACEAVERRIEREYPNAPLCTLHLSQNAPFTLLVDSWNTRTRSLAELSDDDGRAQSAVIHAPVLANRNPVYGISGGVFDVLHKTNGHMYAVTNEETKQSQAEFTHCEGYDIDPAAAVAYASLKQAIALGRIPTTDLCMLNITGAGYAGIFQSFNPQPLSPNWTIDVGQMTHDTLASLLLE